MPYPHEGFVQEPDNEVFDELAFRGGYGELQRVVARAHLAVVTNAPLPAFSGNKNWRKRKQLERPVQQSVPLCMQPFGILAGTVIDDVVDKGRKQMKIIHRQYYFRFAVG